MAYGNDKRFEKIKVMKIIAVVVTYNAMTWIDRCLQSLSNSSIAVLPIVIDNNSQDGTVNHIAHCYPHVILCSQNENRGFGQANNIGLEYAIKNGADYVLLLNQDAWISRDMLEVLMRFADDKTILSPKHLNGLGTALDKNFQTFLLRNLSEQIVSTFLTNPQEKAYCVDFVNAACWLLPINLLLQVGGFNPLFSHYGEDNQYVQRVLSIGGHVKVIPSVSVWHDREQFGNKNIFDRGYYYRRFLLIHAHAKFGFCDYLFVHIRTIVRLIIALLVNKQQAQNIQFAYQLLWNNRSNIQESKNIEKYQQTPWLKL